MRFLNILTTGFALVASSSAFTEEPLAVPRAIPLTRPDMKQMLEDMKQRTPRIPLPPLTDEEKAKLGERGGGYEGRLRALYGGYSGGAGGGGKQDTDPNVSLDYKFKTQLFWIVSRTNNCQYCMGHQESKLLNAGMTEDEIAALDGDWSNSTPAQRAAYVFARKFTFEPHKLNDDDINNLRKHYKDLQIIEMILSMAGNNAINRWKEGVGVPQSSGGGGFGNRGAKGENPPKEAPKTEAKSHSYVTPTSEAFKKKITLVAPHVVDENTGKHSAMTTSFRPKLEPRDEVEKALENARKRTARLPLVDDAKARELLPMDYTAPSGTLPEWIRLMANFTGQGKSRIAAQLTAETKGDLKPLLKAQLAWIIARQDRAWYATARAKQQLKDLGQTDDQIYALDGEWKNFSTADQALFTVARKLACSPVILTDADVAVALKETSPRDVVQTVTFVTTCASFDRITEAAGLRAEK
jgi:AhpD family alkylhydroperoxidase